MRCFHAVNSLGGAASLRSAVGSGVALARYSGDVLSPARLGNRFRGTGRVPLISRCDMAYR
jgi:hypothetical protein